jgi:hypothetical protein
MAPTCIIIAVIQEIQAQPTVSNDALIWIEDHHTQYRFSNPVVSRGLATYPTLGY